jgi:DNA polymerase sigma
MQMAQLPNIARSETTGSFELQEGAARKPSERLVLNALQKALTKTHTLTGPSDYINARVPIVTGQVIGGMHVDVSARVRSSDITAEGGVALMQDCVDVHPQTRPIVLVLKAMLKNRDLHKVRLCDQ